jgi:hypothetical protein
MLFQMLGELLNALGEDGNLDFRRTGVAFMSFVCLNDNIFLFFCDHDYFPFCFIYPASKQEAERIPDTIGFTLKLRMRARAVVCYHSSLVL